MDNNPHPNQPINPLPPQPQTEPPTPPAQPTQTPPTSPKNPKKNLPLIILASIAALAIIIAAVLFIILSARTEKPATADSNNNTNNNSNNSNNNENNETNNPPSNQNNNNPPSTSDQNDTQRKDDLDRFLASITDFASNNSGRIPFTLEQNTFTEHPNFVTRYIDDTCKNGPSTNSTFACSANQFRDPDGELYSFHQASLSSAQNPDKSINLSNPPKQTNHQILVAIGYTCGTDEGTVKMGANNRQAAFLMALEDGSIICKSNS